MDKIGLICNYYVRNYGSVLQSFALYKYLKNQNKNICLIKHIPVPTKKQAKQIKLRVGSKYLFNKKYIINKIKSIINPKQRKEFLSIRKKRGIYFDEFINKHIDCFCEYSDIKNIKDCISQYTSIVLGSDQLWGLADILTDYHTLSFVPDEITKIAYATSFGVSALPKTFEKKARMFLQRFDFLSVREISGREIIEKAINKDVPIVVDPVLLIDKEEWEELIGDEAIVEGDYIFCFLMGNNPEHRVMAKKISDATNLKIVSIAHLDEYIPCDKNFADLVMDNSSPEMFLNLIKNAKHVITDSFHTTVFSVIFKRNFYTLYRYGKRDKLSKNTRITSILQNFGLTDRLIVEPEKFDIDKIYEEINYMPVNERLNYMKKSAYEYLNESLK